MQQARTRDTQMSQKLQPPSRRILFCIQLCEASFPDWGGDSNTKDDGILVNVRITHELMARFGMVADETWRLHPTALPQASPSENLRQFVSNRKVRAQIRRNFSSL